MDKTEILRILTGLDDTGAIAEVHFDMSELGERAEAIAQVHEEELIAADARWSGIEADNVGKIIDLEAELAALQAQVAMMAEALQAVSQAGDWHSVRGLVREALSAAPKVLFHEQGEWYEDGTLIAKHLKVNTMLYTSQKGQQVEVFVVKCPVKEGCKGRHER